MLVSLMLMPALHAAGAARHEPAHLDVEIRRVEQLYPVKGRDFAALTRQMRLLGPMREAGLGRTAALTRAEFVWEFTPQVEGGQCVVIEPRVDARIEVILPEWRNAPGGESAMKAEWTRFLEALRSHERLHEEVAAESADEIARAIAATPPDANCISLRRAVNQRARDVLQRFRERNRDIDALSAHGTAEGTRLVPPTPRNTR